MRTCKTCGQEKGDHDFGSYTDKKTDKEYFNKVCRVCNCVRQKERMTDTRLEWNYGISRAHWEMILKSQDGKCKICHSELDGKICVDHDHEIHVVRGLLCYKCNTGIGLLRDDPIRLIAAANYLKRKPNALKELYHGE